MRMYIQDLFKNEAGEWENLHNPIFSWPNCGGWETPEDGQRELMKRWHDRGVTKYRNGIEFPNSPIKGMMQRIWFAE